MPKITDLSPAATLDGTEELPLHQSSTTAKTTVDDVAQYSGANLPASGVTPGTYGDATHVGAFTVGADGRITAASNVAASGGGGGGTTIAATFAGRLTLTSATPVTTTDVTGATSVYFTPYRGAQIGLYNGTSWDIVTFAETSLALGTLTSGKNYDVFAYNNAGTLALELSAAWASDSARTDALAQQDGVYVKSSAHTRRYLGTFRTTSTTTTEDSAAKRFLWNCENRVPRAMSRVETTTTWTYTLATWRQANGSTANQLSFVVGLDGGSAVTANCAASAHQSSSCGFKVGIGVDSTTAPSGIYTIATTSGDVSQMSFASVAVEPAAGYHYLAWLEHAQPTGTLTWNGVATGNFATQSGICGSLMG
jgi:hypothetical protein